MLSIRQQPTSSSSSHGCCHAPQRPQHQLSSRAVERVYQLADVRRGASLSDVRVEVNVAHTKSRLKARFFVEMKRVDAAGVVDAKWGFGVFMSEVKSFESQLLRLVKKHRHGLLTKRCAQCAMCDELRAEMKHWDKLSSLQTIGKRHMDAKCERVTAFFYKLLRLVSARAQWLQSCELLREILRRTEELCHVEYPNDRAAICVIESLKRLPSQQQQQLEQDDCSICLNSLQRTSDDSAPAARGGVELRCGHRFHDTCICLWFHTRLNCPVCRTHAVPQASESA